MHSVFLAFPVELFYKRVSGEAKGGMGSGSPTVQNDVPRGRDRGAYFGLGARKKKE